MIRTTNERPSLCSTYISSPLGLFCCCCCFQFLRGVFVSPPPIDIRIDTGQPGRVDKVHGSEHTQPFTDLGSATPRTSLDTYMYVAALDLIFISFFSCLTTPQNRAVPDHRQQPPRQTTTGCWLSRCMLPCITCIMRTEICVGYSRGYGFGRCT